MTGIDNPSNSQSPNKPTKSAINDVFCAVERSTSFLIDSVYSIYNGYAKTSAHKPTDQANKLPWYFILNKKRKCQMYDTNDNLLTEVTKCWKIKGWWLVTRPHHSARPMRFGSRGPNESLKCIDLEGLGRHRTCRD